MKDGGRSHSNYPRRFSQRGSNTRFNENCEKIIFKTDIQNIQSA